VFNLAGARRHAHPGDRARRGFVPLRHPLAVREITNHRGTEGTERGTRRNKRTISLPSSARERTAAKFGLARGAKQSFADGRSQAELGNEGVGCFCIPLWVLSIPIPLWVLSLCPLCLCGSF